MRIQILACGLLVALGACQPAASERPAAETPEPVATAAQGNCRIEVEGKVWLDKPCDYMRDGVLVVNSRSVEGEDYVYIDEPDAATSTATWSGGGGARHAHDPLGDLTREGSCWSGDGTRVCLPAAFTAAEGSGAIDPSHCLIRVDGKVWLDARCPADASDPEAIGVNVGIDGASTFALVNTSNGEARAYWNGGDGSSHATTDLGVVTVDGACWSNARARICRPLTPEAPPA